MRWALLRTGSRSKVRMPKATRLVFTKKGLLRFMARPERFELPTPRFEAWCSIQLSYGRRREA